MLENQVQLIRLIVVFIMIINHQIGKKAKIKQENEKKESRKQKNRLKTDEKMA